MSVFCPKCGKKTFNEYTCDYCQNKIKEEKIIKKNWKPAKTIKIKNPLIIIPLIIITTIMILFTYNTYKKKELYNKMFKEVYGANSPEEFIEMNDKERKKAINNSKTIKNVKKEMNKILNSFKMIDLPIKINKSPINKKLIKKENIETKEKKKLNIIITDINELKKN